ncbi:MAG: single-stranded DNA-binding protein [Lachnospiraceae bacterium]|nr:single-stranded DNA-binding protein [Lachnospiraceae bacterium]
MNKIILMGRLVNDPELKTTPNGVSVCSFRLAVDRNYRKKDEEKKADFFNVSCWRSTAEFVAKWFAKGRMILVEGELQTRQYTDKNGNAATWYEIVADNAYFTGEKPNDTPQSPAPYAQTAAPTASNAQTAADYSADNSDDYPF